MDKYRIYGELITSNLYKIPQKKVSFVTLENYYNNNEQVTIPLDIKYLPSYNAKKYFKKYSKLKNALEIVNIQKKETLKQKEAYSLFKMEFNIYAKSKNHLPIALLVVTNLCLKKSICLQLPFAILPFGSMKYYL